MSLTTGARPRVWLLAALAPAALLVVDPWGYAPFGPARWAVVSVLALAGVATAGWTSGVRVWRPAAIAWLVFAGWVLISAGVGMDPVYAWIGTAERHLGALTWLLCGLLFVVGHTLDDDGDARLVVGAAVGATGAAGAWAVAEELGWQPVRLAASTRLVGSLGSAAYLGAAMALGVPLALGVALDRSWCPMARWSAALAAALATTALIGSGARAAWVGVIGAAVVLLAVRKDSIVAVLRRRPGGAAGVVVTATVAVAVIAAFSGSRGRIVDLVEHRGGGGLSRVDEWRLGLAVVRDHPVTGVGPEGYRIAFASVVTARYQEAYGRSPVPDRAHDGPLDVAVTTGLPGATAYLVLLALCGALLVRDMRDAEPWLLGAAAGLLAYGLQELLLFPIGELEPVVWLLVGMVAVRTVRPGRLATVRLPRGIAMLATTLAVVAAFAGIRDVVADHDTRAALRDLAADRLAAAQNAARRAVALRPDQIDYRLAAARTDAPSDGVEGINRALGEMAAALRTSPRDPVVREEKAALLVQRAQLTRAPADVTSARTYLVGLTQGDRFNPQTQLQLGVVLALSGDGSGAERAWNAAARLAPTDSAGPTNLATLYARERRWADAAVAARAALARDPVDTRAAAVLAEAAAQKDGT